MKKYTVTGMSCAACSARVQNAVEHLDGVASCNVNLLTNSMTVESTLTDSEIISAVEKAGYGASVYDSSAKAAELVDRETPRLLKRLFTSLFFLLALMYLSMGYNMLSFPLPKFLTERPLFIGILQMLLALIVIIINRNFYINGIKGIITRSLNMDTLVSIGSCAGFVYSVITLITMITDPSHHHLHDLYFESSAMILVLITVGKALEAYSKGKTTNAIKSLLSLAPKTATVIIDGEYKTIDASALKIGDIFVVKSGESVAADGVVTDGSASVDEASLTGESIPVDKSVNDSVFAATIVKSGFITCRATAVSGDTTLDRIIDTVREASSGKAPISKVADRVSGVFVPAVIIIAAITLSVWLILGREFSFALSRAIAVLVISCPCALGLATPVAIMVSSGVGARHGLLFKSAESLEITGKSTVVVLDKTGTITRGEPQVTDVLSYDVDDSTLMTYAASLEQKSEHPLSRAITSYAAENNVTLSACDEFEVFPGNGLCGTVLNHRIIGGNLHFIQSKVEVSPEIIEKSQQLSSEGKTPLFFMCDSKLIGIIAVSDVVREDSRRAIERLLKLKIHVVMLSGDNRRTAEAIAKSVGISDVYADVLPQDKASVIRKLQQNATVIMVGDGINDAPALTLSDVGIAIGRGTDIAIDSSDVVLMKDSLMGVVNSILLSRRTLKTIHQNLFWAFLYNTIGIPIAAGVLSGVGITLSPMLGALAMSLSSFCVVTNALRINFFKAEE